MIDRWARRAVLGSLGAVRGGRLLVTRDGDVEFDGGQDGELRATLDVRRDRFFRRAAAGGGIGLGESYMDGDWSTPDLVALLRLMLRNLPAIDGLGGLPARLALAAGALGRRLRGNSLEGSRRNIHRHYDIGNGLFRLFLDEDLVYSCALYESWGDTLEQAQRRKLDRICRKLLLGPADHVLEIGSGWGAFAVWAATRCGCRVTTTTISEEQYRYAREWAARLGEAGSRIQVLKSDYRELRGRFDKIVSIEMFEAVGLDHYDDYFGAVDRLLAPDGSMLLQTITVDDQYFPRYHGGPDWIEKYIFPGGELASLAEVAGSLARVTSLSMYHAENFGAHYARTLREWRSRFHRRLNDVYALGFDERFVRMWDLYLAYCEAAFLERHTGVYQLVLRKNSSRARMFNEPHDELQHSQASANPDVARVFRPAGEP